MTALIIIGSLLLLLLFLLLMPVHLDLRYRNEKLELTAGYLFLRFDFSDEARTKRAERAAKRKAKKKPKTPKQAAEDKEAVKEKRSLDSVKNLWSFLKSSRTSLDRIRRHIVFSHVEIFACVGSEDAHKTAMAYTQLLMLVTAAIDVVGSLFVLRTPIVGIAPDFTKEKSAYDISLRVGIRPLSVAAGISILIRFLLVTKNNQKRKKQLVEGEKQHEPTTNQ